jgi:hypothetical protein
VCEVYSGDVECLRGSKGVLAVPLGYSLMLAGGTWAAGTQLFSAEDEAPWIQIAVGIVLGATAYALSAALDPGLTAR